MLYREQRVPGRAVGGGRLNEKKGQRADSKAVAVTAGNWRNFAEGKLAVVIKSGLVLAEFPRPFFPGQALLRGPPTSSLRLRPTTSTMHDDARELGGRSGPMKL